MSGPTMRNFDRPGDASLLERHRAFWECAPVRRPMVGVTLAGYFAVQMFPASPNSGYLLPEDVRVGDFLESYERQFAAEARLPGDQVWGAAPFTGIPWMEAIVGCPVSASGDTIWADRITDPWAQIENVTLGPENGWFQKLLEFTRSLAELSRDRFPVGPTVMRGPADVLAAARGREALCLDFYDRRDATRRALLRCGQLWVQVTRAQLAAARAFRGGYGAPYRAVWAPGTCVEMQEDASGLVSPSVYRQFIQPADDLVAASFDYPLFHVHSGSLHALEDIVGVRGLRCVEITIDVGGPPLADVVPRIRLVQEKGLPVLVHGTLSPTDVAHLARDLSPVGLYIVSRVKSLEEGRQVVAAIGRGAEKGG